MDLTLEAAREAFGLVFSWPNILYPVVGTVIAMCFAAMPGLSGITQGMLAVFRNFGLFLRSSVIGTVVGMIPGIGGTVAGFVAYGHAAQTARDPSQFGKGDIRGVLAAESANDAGALVPTLAFGIPGGAGTALLLVAPTLQGLVPGRDHGARSTTGHESASPARLLRRPRMTARRRSPGQENSTRLAPAREHWLLPRGGGGYNDYRKRGGGVMGRRWSGVAVAAGVLAISLGAEGAQVREAAGVRDIIGHRGSSADRPENTLASVRRAIEAGATAVEVDVRTTRDGHLVILHDATLDRTTNGSGPVGERTLEEIRRLDAGGWFDSRYRGERIPTLAEVLALCRQHRVDVLLDLKEDGEAYARAVAAEVRATGDPGRAIVGVRSPARARLFRELLPESRQLGFIPRPEEIEAFAQAGVETIRLWAAWLEDESLAPRVRRAGATLHLNAAVCDPDEIRTLLEFQPAAILCDDPARLVDTLAKLRGETEG